MFRLFVQLLHASRICAASRAMCTVRPTSLRISRRQLACYACYTSCWCHVKLLFISLRFVRYSLWIDINAPPPSQWLAKLVYCEDNAKETVNSIGFSGNCKVPFFYWITVRKNSWDSGVARIWCEGGMKLRELFLLERQPHGVKCQSLCGFEVTWKIKQLEVEGEPGTCPSAP